MQLFLFNKAFKLNAKTSGKQHGDCSGGGGEIRIGINRRDKRPLALPEVNRLISFLPEQLCRLTVLLNSIVCTGLQNIAL